MNHVQGCADLTGIACFCPVGVTFEKHKPCVAGAESCTEVCGFQMEWPL